jgi:hypothetical protein
LRAEVLEAAVAGMSSSLVALPRRWPRMNGVIHELAAIASKNAGRKHLI